MLTTIAVAMGAVPSQAASAPGAPQLLAPPADHVFGPAESQLFTLRVSDADDDDWLGHVELTEVGTGVVTVHATTLGESGGTSDAVAPPPLRPGTYTWRARAMDSTGALGSWSETRSFTVGNNRPPHAPELLSPSNGATLRRGGNLPFSVTAVDADNDPFRGTITILDAAGAHVTELLTSPAPSGSSSFGVLAQPLREGTYTWSARVADVHGAPSVPSGTRTFTIAPPPTAGGGVVVGTVGFASPGMPSTIGVCEPTSPTFDLLSTAAVINSVVVGYVGPLELRGTGASACESALFGTGSVTFDATGTSATESTLTCQGLTGSYVRVEAVLVVTLQGGCRINNRPVSRLTLEASLAFAPRQSTAGITTRVRDATVSGAFAVAPE